MYIWTHFLLECDAKIGDNFQQTKFKGYNFQQMGTILTRIQEISTREKIKIGAIEKIIGASKGVLSRAIANGTDIQAKWIQRIVENYPLYSPRWLLTGEGDMLVSTQPTLPTIPTHTETSIPVYKGPMSSIHGSKKSKGLPLIPIDAVAGFPAADNDGVYMEDCEHYSIPEFEAKGANFLIRVSGDSMMPLYNNGDIIACRKISDILFFQWGSIYVLDTSQGALVKRIEECEKNDDCILCVSENPRFKPFQLPKTDIRSLSTIIGLVRLV